MQILTKVGNKIQFIIKFKKKVKDFLAEENLSAEEVKKAEVLFRWKSKEKKYTYFARFARRYLSAPSYSVYSEENLEFR